MNTFNPWKYFRTFYSSEQSQRFLGKCYKKLNNTDKLSFKNSYPFIYYLEHGKKYFDQSKLAPFELQPVLLFYGMVQLMKAAILTFDPNYPETTQVLAHGVSTRKRKKSDYEFLFDEVKVQKNGLFSHFALKVFDINYLEGEKYKMDELMRRIPELHQIFRYTKIEDVSFQVMKCVDGFYLDSKILDKLHLSKEAFLHLLRDQNKINKEFKFCHEEKGKLLIKENFNFDYLFCSPFQFNLSDHQFYCPIKRELFSFFPEILAHYLILYNLSMVCRYETEWWGELFHHYPSTDYPFITDFLEITKEKVPFYISLILHRHKGLE